MQTYSTGLGSLSLSERTVDKGLVNANNADLVLANNTQCQYESCLDYPFDSVRVQIHSR